MLETGRALGITFDGHLAIWSSSWWSQQQRAWLEMQHPWQWARAPPAPLGSLQPRSPYSEGSGPSVVPLHQH